MNQEETKNEAWPMESVISDFCYTWFHVNCMSVMKLNKRFLCRPWQTIFQYSYRIENFQAAIICAQRIHGNGNW